MNSEGIKVFLKKYGPSIISWVGVVGVGVTGYFSAKDTEERIKKSKYKEVKTVKDFLLLAEDYKRTIFSGVLTIGAILTADRINFSQKAIMTANLVAAKKNFERMIKDIREADRYFISEDGKEKYIEERSQDYDINEKRTFVIDYCGKPIEMSLKELLTTEYLINRTFILKGDLTINEFRAFFGIKEPVENGDKVGWDTFIGEAYYGYKWIDFASPKEIVQDDGGVIYGIETPFEAHPLDEEEMDEMFNLI
ncbi:MAG: DUF6353 family protein [Eubacteriales bacterium]|nr:DUF6353 family protein [Eubacteriales bacterium]